MHVRSVLALAGVAGLLAVPFAIASPGGSVQSATGGIHWTIPLPNPFEVEVRNQPLAFTARKDADGNVTGHFTYHQVVEGESFNFGVDVTCMNIYDGNRAKIGGVIRTSNDPTLPPGMFAWFQVFDNGEGADDAAGSVEPDRIRERGRQRGVLQQPEPTPLRSLGRAGKRPGPAVGALPLPGAPLRGVG